MSPHTLDNFNLHSPLRRSLAHSLNAASCPWQFQFIFPVSAVDRTFLEYSFISSIISIYIPHSLNVASCSQQFQFFIMAVNHTFLEYSFMFLMVSIYIPRLRRSLAHSLNVSFMPSTISIHTPRSGGRSHIP